MDKKFIVKLSEISDDVILELLDFGTVDHVSEHTNICSITMDTKNLKKLKLCKCVLSVRESQLGKWLGLKEAKD